MSSAMDESLAQRSGVTIGDMKSCWTRRDLIRLAVALPAGDFSRITAPWPPPICNRVKITNVRAMAIQNIAGNCLIRIDTDSGLTGYGEAGSTGPMARARIETMKPLLIGKDPLLIEVHFHQHDHADAHLHGAHPDHQRHRHGALGPGRQDHRRCRFPRCSAARSARRSRCTRTASDLNMLDKASCRDWAQRIKQDAGRLHGLQEQHRSGAGRARRRGSPQTLRHSNFATSARGYTNCREAVGDEIDIAVHCHNELDSPSAVGRGQGGGADESAVPGGCAESAVLGGLDGAAAVDASAAADRREAGDGARVQAVPRQPGSGHHPSRPGICRRHHRARRRSPTTRRSPARRWRCTMSARWC